MEQIKNKYKLFKNMPALTPFDTNTSWLTFGLIVFLLQCAVNANEYTNTI